jgi:ADP-ribosylglycohydrolase
VNAAVGDPSRWLLGTLAARYRGLLLGLAIGDALGMPVQHRRPGTFLPVGDLVAGGPYDLPRGCWTDDTAVPLCLAESLCEVGHADLLDMQARLALWQREGRLSSSGQCIGISAATARALAAAQSTGDPLHGVQHPTRIDREPLGRAGVAVAFAHPDLALGIRLTQQLVLLTHGSLLAVECAGAYAALLAGALRGMAAEELLSAEFVPGELQRVGAEPLSNGVMAMLEGGWQELPDARLAGLRASAGGALEGLAVALGALHHGRASFRAGVLWAVNLGGDADTNGAIAGQLLGALHGADALPRTWVETVAAGELLTDFGARLLTAALDQLAVEAG